MTTSGTIGNTQIKTAKLLEKALRRCGLAPNIITPEIVSTAQEDLYMFLMSLATRGLNLWCVDKQLIGLKVGQATYSTPVGTLDVLNLMHCTPTVALDGTLFEDANNYQLSYLADQSIVRFGVQFNTLTVSPIELQTSVDGLVWVTVKTLPSDLVTGVVNWYDLDPVQTSSHFRIHSVGAFTVANLYLVSGVREIAISAFNRDDYANQPNKTQQSDFATNYFYEKLISPRFTLWPVPANQVNHVSMFRYRQVQDVGTLTEELEIPVRWLEAITWQLALRRAFEIPQVDPARRQEVAAMAQTQTIEIEAGETDGAPIYYAPNIGVYTR